MICLYCEVLDIFLLSVLSDFLIYTVASVYLQTVGTSLFILLQMSEEILLPLLVFPKV